MGNKLSACSCAPLMRKAYRYEDSPWQTSKRRDGHLLRLWAEVFHVSASGAGSVKWQQVSEDLVPVNITCIQDAPNCIFLITAYNSQVDKILDVKLVQPGTRIGQASECFVYWKDPNTNDTWGLNFTSPIDARQFRECCSPSFKFSRKASSSYSLKLDPPSKGNKIKTKRKPLSTPASPNRSREPQCTCMTPEQYARLRAQQDPRFRGSSTLPRAQNRLTDSAPGINMESLRGPAGSKVTAATSSTSLYDNVAICDSLPNKANACTATATGSGTRDRETATPGGKVGEYVMAASSVATATGSQTEEGQQSKNEGVQTGISGKTTTGTCTPRTLSAKSRDESSNTTGRIQRMSSKEHDMRSGPGVNLDPITLKKMLKPVTSVESPITSPEMTRCRYNYYNSQAHAPNEPEMQHKMNRFSGSRSSHEIGRIQQGRSMYLDLERQPGGDISPPSDNVLFDNQCYATTPSSSNGRCYHETASTPSSPTSRLLLEYEMHLRNTLAKGMDAESYSLHTFEALLSHSMENLEFAQLPLANGRSPYPIRRRVPNGGTLGKSKPLVSKSNGSFDRPASSAAIRDREGYYSDRNELLRERGYMSDKEREKGYLSDQNAPRMRNDYSNRCASCLGESARASWFRHSDGWRSGSSTLGSAASGLSAASHYPSEHGRAKRNSAWDSLPSLRHENSLNDSGYKSARTNSLEQRQDSLRSDYTSDRESRYGITQQTSIESTDSRLCYLTSSEMSDDDRMSLTTAVSDEEDVESAHVSPYRPKQAGTAAASFNCTGAVRKAGFLSVKKWLLRKKHQIELARKRGWKGYWVCLKGTTLLFYPCDSREGRSVDAAPKHLIIVDGAIMQPIPEHPKRDYIFCLSTAFGDAYLFQAPCQVELENWVNSIHSACAAAFARHRGKTGTLHLLQEEIFRLEKAIDSDNKLKHMADLQMSVLTEPENKQQINEQITQWEENLERLHCEQFRLRCYMASLQNGELPNPKSLLTHVSRNTKCILNNLGVFTVSSFHAFICARSPSLLNNLLAGRGATKRRPPLLSRSNSGSSRRSLQSTSSRDEQDKSVKVSLPENQYVHIYLKDAMTVEEFLNSACSRKNFNPMEHFVRVKKRQEMEDHNYFVPHRGDLIETYLSTHEVVEVCAKILYQVELQRTNLDHMWGFSVEAELAENAERQDELCCYVSRVEDKSVAMQNGLIKGDEIMVINGAIVSDLDMMYLESVLQEELSLYMMIRSSRTEPPENTGSRMLSATDDMIESLVCPPPPMDPLMISEEMICDLIVPAPTWNKEHNSTGQIPEKAKSGGSLYNRDLLVTENNNSSTVNNNANSNSRGETVEIENLIKSAGEVTGFCRSPVMEIHRTSPTSNVANQISLNPMNITRQLTDAEKLSKVIIELIETERTYVKNLNGLLENYLEPLKKENFLSGAEISALFGNILEIVAFQRQFLQNLIEALEHEVDFHHFDQPSQFKNLLFSIGSAFLYYVNQFKLYSSFCASHSKAQKVLHPNEGNQALQEFLSSRNPKQQHSSTLESYLIKPIQRILKYPLLLQQLCNLTDPHCDEHLHLVEALKGMEKVAEHINEMQRIHEEYGAIFDHLFRQHQKSCKQPIDLSPGDLLYYGGVEWLNISDFLGKIKKGLELHAMCFVFKSAVVFLCKERLRQKKKLIGVSNKSCSNEVEIIRYQVLVPVTEVQVRASSAKDMDSHFLWELIHLRSQVQRRTEKVYVLSNSTAEFRNAFLKTIRQIIRESVRNMSIPITKPGMPAQIVSNTLGRHSSTGKSAQEQSSIKTSLNAGCSQTLEKSKKPPRIPQRHSSGSIEYEEQLIVNTTHNTQSTFSHEQSTQSTFRGKMKPMTDTHTHGEANKETRDCDPGTKSEGEEDSITGAVKKSLGRTPNHLTLSTTSTLSAGSTGNQAKLIQSSQHPVNYQPLIVKDLGSPVWKPRDFGEASTLPRKNKAPATNVTDTRTLGRAKPHPSDNILKP